ncbi:MAG: hypothetical protein JO083_08810 [Candidatus Eremiobacteraeota bacterium]|nr:hypothetical protein [Candidatus Eremiobacteraeota bacterium]
MNAAALHRAAGLATVLLGFAPLAGCGSEAQNASAAEPNGGARQCASAWLGRELPAGAQVELLVAAGATIPAGRWPAYRAMAGAVAGCAGESATVTLRPITADSLTELPVFAGEVPAPTGQNSVNPLRYRSDQRAFVVKTAAAVDKLPGIGTTTGGSDPLGALTAAGQDFRTAPAASQHVVVAIFNGWQQTRSLNLFRYRSDPAGSTAAALRDLRASGALPDLSGTEIVIVGLTPGDARMQTSDAQLAGLCRFWRSLVEAGHGRLRLCAAGLPGIDRNG